jgi:hypothetical protein
MKHGSRAAIRDVNHIDASHHLKKFAGKLGLPYHFQARMFDLF